MKEDSTLELVSELAREFLERCRLGRRPAMSEYTEQYPELADQIREVFSMMLLMEEVAPEGSASDASELDLKKLGDFTIHRVIGRGGMGLVYEATQESLGRRVAIKVCPLTTPHLHGRHQERFRRESRAAAMLHHTNIVPVFAVGEAEGILYYAMQFIEGATLDDVILELNQLWQSQSTSSTRLTEAGVHRSSTGKALASQVAKSLASSNLKEDSSDSQIHLADGDPETSEDVAKVSLPGQSATDSGNNRTTKYWDSVARIGVQIADALAYAHGKGTLHRDVKPGNLMLDQSGTIWVMDFGLAKPLEANDLTQEGELIGTLRYMAPEQCAGKPEQASDIYGLGLTLYELLALRPAYTEVNRPELLRAISERDPIPPRRINRNVPRDLETITMKCIERQPSKRYRSAQHLIHDLNRFLAGEPIHARPVTSMERVAKWAKRRPMVAGLSTALATLFLCSFAAISWKWRDAESARELAYEKEKAAVAQTQLANDRLEATEVALYRNAISRIEATSDSAPETAKRLLTSLMPSPGQTDRRGWEWGYLNALVNQEVVTLQAGAPQAEWIRALAFSNDERLLAVGSARPYFVSPVGTSPRGRVTVWDVSTAKLVAELPIEDSCRALAFSPDAKRLVVSEPVADHHLEDRWRGPTRIWDLESRTPLVALQMPGGNDATQATARATNLAYSPDGGMIAGTVWSNDTQPDKVAIWDTSNGEELWSIPEALLLSIDDDSSLIVASFQDYQLHRYDLATRAAVEVIPGSVNGTVARHDARTGVIAQTYEGRLQVGIPNRKLRMFYGDDGFRVSSEWPAQPIVCFHPTERRLASGTTGGNVRIWQSDLGVSERILRGHADSVQALAFSQTGRWLASGDWKGEVRVWEPDRNRHRVRCRPRSHVSNGCMIEAVAFRWGSSNLVSYSQFIRIRGKLSSWETERGHLIEDVPVDSRLDLPAGLESQRRQVAFSGDGARVLTTDGSRMHVVDTHNGRLIYQTSPQVDLTDVAIDARGETFASVHLPLRLRNAGVATEPHLHPSPLVQVWKYKEIADHTLTPVFTFEDSNGVVQSIALSSSGDRVAFGLRRDSRHDSLIIVNVADDPAAQTELKIELEGAISALEFSPTGETLAICLDRGELQFLDAESGNKLTSNSNVPTGIVDLAWHPSGTRLAGVNRETVTLWDADGQELLKLRSDERIGDMPFDACVCFSLNGEKLASTQWNNVVNIWSATEFELPSSAGTISGAAVARASSSRLALRAIDEIAAEAPHNAWLLATRGYLRSVEGMADLARADYQRAKELLAGNDDCLLIDSQAYIQVPSLPLDRNKGYTMEAWVKHWNSMQLGPGGQSFGVIAAQYPQGPSDYYQYLAHKNLLDLDTLGTFWLQPSVFDLFQPPENSSKWTHVVVAIAKDQRHTFIDGELVRSLVAKPGQENLRQFEEMTDFFIGTTEFHNPAVKGRGLLRSIRVSDGLIYDRDPPFQPPQNFKSSQETLLLFDFEQGRSLKDAAPASVQDLSGRENHGVLRNGWW